MLSRSLSAVAIRTPVIRNLSSAGMILPRSASSLLKNSPASLVKRSSITRSFSDKSAASAIDAFKLSCYLDIDYTISEDATVYDAVQKLSAYDVGALVTVNSSGVMSGVISERDYICKIALLGRTSKETKVKEISTKAGNLITAKPTDSIEMCMDKVLSRGIRHMPIVDDNGGCVGFLSVKDLLKEVIKTKESEVKRLASFALGGF